MDFTVVKKNLEELGYQVSCFDTAAAAADYMNLSLDGKRIGFGGSVTLQEMGLYERLEAHNQVNWHWKVPEGKTAKEILAEAQSAEVYLSSVNGLAETGEIINIDGNCNRIGAMLYGHEKVILVVGENKIAPDYDEALDRARNVAAPLNAKRLQRRTPCAVRGDRCYNCKSPERICRGLSGLWCKPNSGDYEIILIHEKLGY